VVPCFFGEFHDLVFDGRAIARPFGLDHTGVERRTVEIVADDPVRFLIRIRDPARELSLRQTLREMRKREPAGSSPGLLLTDIKVDRLSIEARGVPVLSRPSSKSELPERTG